MIHAIDTDFLVAVEIRDHVFHQPADALLNRLLQDGHEIAVAPQTLAEFVHVTTDSLRMKEPLSVVEAISRSEHWWQAREVFRLFPDGDTVSTWLGWIKMHRLGRKRLLDTLLASACKAHEISRIVTNNSEDYQVFASFELLSYKG